MVADMSLPIDNVLPQLRTLLARHGCVVLSAAPGAGKTTRVPPALLGEAWLADKSIVMLEPRRLAAVNAATYMSRQLGEKVGGSVGYTIRQQRRVSARTRIEVVTEGILTRRLHGDPELGGVGLVIFDEFHERHLHSDLALALTRCARNGWRDDLKLLVMSATIDCAALSAALDNCPTLECAGRSFPVQIDYCGDSGAPLPQQVAAALEQLLDAADDDGGDVLVFLPGAAEINTCLRQLQPLAQRRCLELLPLYAALPYERQRRALSAAKQRKVVLATNIAETSLTIAGITAVIDSGLEKQLRFDPASGMNRLHTTFISNASAVQRAGRAGRTAPGRCLRLWRRERQLQPYATAEITRSDLCALELDVALWDCGGSEQLEWIDPPPPVHARAARRVLQEIGAVAADAAPTAAGRRLAQLPLHPRLAAMVLAAADANELVLAAHLAVLLEEGWQALSVAARRRGGVDVGDCLTVWRSEMRAGGCTRSAASLSELLRRLGVADEPCAAADAATLARLLLSAFPDRVARRREDSADVYQLRNGSAVVVAMGNWPAPRWLVAVQLEAASSGEVRVAMAAPLTEQQVLARFERHLSWRDEVVWQHEQQRAVRRRCRRLDALVLAAEPLPLAAQDALALLLEQIRRHGLELLGWDDVSRNWLQRARFAAVHGDDWPPLDDAALLATLEKWLAPALDGVTSVAQLRKVTLLAPLRNLLDWRHQRQMEKLAPEKITVPSGARVRIDYSDTAAPLLAVKLQEVFGWQESPRIANGQVPLRLHLLSPARRPLQVTSDLASFWRNGYAEVRKQMRGRYPKHPWPEDPLTAVAQRGVKRR